MSQIFTNVLIPGGSLSNNAFHFLFEFTASTAQAAAGPWQFRFGPDFGFGGVMLLDGNVLQAMWAHDMWWDYQWTDPTQFLENGAGVAVGAGSHVFEVYGFDDCCDGAMEADVSIGGAGWQVISSALLGPVLASQSIAFPPIVNVPITNGTVILTVTSNSRLSVTLTSSTLSVCTVSGSTVTLKALGLCTINATQAGNANYYAATPVSQSFTVMQALPVVTWAQPGGITFGTALGGAQLDAAASVPGTFVYSPAAGTVLSAGNAQTLSVTFVPNDAGDYSTAFGSTTINVAQAAASVTWAPPAGITFGTALGSAQLDASASVAGNFVYTPAAGAVLSAGNGQTLSVTFTPSDTKDYANAAASTTINVGKVTPALSWAAPAAITAGSPLGAGQLDAITSVPGSFVYTPPPGTLLPIGNGQPLSVVFTPADTADYNTASGSTAINVIVVATSCVETLSAKIKAPTPGVAGNVQLYWINTWTSTAPVDHYNVYRSQSSDFSNDVQLAGASSPSNKPAVPAPAAAGGQLLFIDATALGQTPYYYRVAAATTADVETCISNQVEGTIPKVR